MKEIRTHYDNLKVAHNAPIEVIRAAYKTLAQKYHPDKNPDNIEAEKIMKIINTSYEVLSDPEKRKQHDLWIKDQLQRSNSKNEQELKHNDEMKTYSSTVNSFTSTVFSDSFNGYNRSSALIWGLLALIGVILLVTSLNMNSARSIYSDYDLKPTTEITSESSNPQSNLPSKPESTVNEYANVEVKVTEDKQYIKPKVAPNGSMWPKSAGYIKNYAKLRTMGNSTIMVDNTANNSDIFLKLVDTNLNFTVRHFYIPAYQSFVLEQVTPGYYDIRYQNLDTGMFCRSEPLLIEEFETQNGIRYTEYTLTLYKVANGNMQTYSLSEDEFSNI